jgi:hypothetical protein
MRSIVTLALVAIVAACQQSPAGETETEVSLLYSLTADAGRLEPAAGTNNFTLTLTGVDAHTIQFADRPSRYSGIIPTADLVEHWAAFFGDDPPNAVLVEHERGTGGTDSLVVTLTDPVYDATAGTLRYAVTLLDDEHAPDRLDSLGRARHATPPTAFDAASLFIDDATGTIINGCVIQLWAKCPNANLSGANLSNANLFYANLSGADLTGANLSGALLTEANLTGAKLSGANLTDVNLSGANLANANLANALLGRAYLVNATLTYVNLAGAWLMGADLSGADLTGASYCATAMPDGPRNTNC